ncbi:MAG: hypothetical protein J6J36_01160 [Clostridia bacterium]|nr:hypothetical protein [Clostridia bacterium]
MKKLFKLSLILAIVMSFIFVLPTNRVRAEENNTHMADVNIGTKTSSGTKVTVTFNHVGEIDQSKISNWLSDGWSVTGNVATRTFDEKTTFAFLEYKTEDEEGNVTIEMATIALPYEIDLSGNTEPEVNTRVINPVINDTNIAELHKENNYTYIRPKKVGETTMTGKIAVGQEKKELDFTWKIKVVDTKGGDNGGSGSGDNGGSGSGDNGGSGSGDNGGSGSGDNGGNGSGDNGGSGSGDNGGNGSGDNGGNNSGDNGGSGSGDNGENNSGDNGGSGSGDNGGNGSENNSGSGSGNNNGNSSGNKKDSTTSPNRISDTGESQLIIIMAVFVGGVAFVAFVKNKKNKIN